MGGIREQFIAENAPGKSFADIGGLFALEGEIAFLAEQHRASRVTLVDGADPTHFTFPEKHAARGSSVRFVQADLDDPQIVDQVGRHDVVFCSGVIYHTPNPIRQLLHLREITGDVLFLGTHTLPELPGLRQLCMYYPFLDEADRRVLATAHYRPESLWGVGRAFDDTPGHGYHNFWWGMTRTAVRAMLRSARFEVVAEPRPREWPFISNFIARPIRARPILPPLSHARQHATQRARRGEALPAEEI